MHSYSIDLYILFNNQNVFEFVSDIEQADIVAMMFPTAGAPSDQMEQQINAALHSTKFNKNQIIVNITYVMHIDEIVTNRRALKDFSTAFDNANIPCKVVHLHTDITLRDDPNNIKNFVYTDFLFNRSHTLHFNNELISANWHKIVKRNHWYNYKSADDNRAFPNYLFEITPDEEIIPTLDRFLKYTSGMYELTPKIFVAPNNSRRGIVEGLPITRSEIRKQLNKFLYDYQGYIGDVSQGTVLVSQQHFHGNNLFDVLGINGWGFSPPHNDYYNTSTLSIYAETIMYHERHRTQCITEKTFTPLCKAHFILPFGAPGTVATLKDEYGFKFPDWIDYSYDNIGIDTYFSNETDQEKKTMLLESKQWEAYLSSVKNVCEIGPRALYHYKRVDFHKDGILLHNRNIMKNFGQRYGLGDPQILQEIMS